MPSMQDRPPETVTMSEHGPAATAANGAWLLNLLAFVVGIVGLVYGLLTLYAFGPFLDTQASWLPWSRPIYDAGLPLWIPHFVGSPVMALLLRPLGILPFPVFVIAWTAVGGATYWWLLRPLAPAPRVVAFAAACSFVLNGNIEWALAAMVVVGMSRPAVWLLAAFAKVAPFVGFGWFVLQRDWQAVAITAVTGTLLVAVSALLLPGAWPVWFGMLATFQGQTQHTGLFVPAVPLLPRLPVALAVLTWGAMRRQPLVLPLVLLLAQPDLQPWALGYLAAAPRLRGGPPGTVPLDSMNASASRAARSPTARAFDTPRSSG